MTMSVRASAETLRRIPLFQDCDPVPLQVMAFSAVSQEFRDGEIVMREGEMTSSAHFIVRGSAKVESGKRAIGTADPGSLLGEVAMLAQRPSQVTVTAIEPLVTARIDHQLFLRVAQEYPEFGQAVVNALGQRLEMSMREFDTIRVMLNKARSLSDL